MIQQVTLEVPVGSITVVLGPSGAGKSTLLRAIAGLVPAEGAIRLFGRDASGLAPHLRRVGLAFQEARLLPHLTLAQNIELPLWVAGIPAGQRAARVADLARRMEIPDVLHRLPDAVSGGQAHRASVARALSTEPRILLVDEAFGTLDTPLRARLVDDVVRVARASSTTIVLVTHDRDLALSTADQIVVLADGRLLQQGTPGEVFNQPATLAVARLVGEMDTLVREGYLLGVRPSQVRLDDGELVGEVLGSRFLGSAFEHRIGLEGEVVRAVDTVARQPGGNCLVRFDRIYKFESITGRRCDSP